MHPSTTRTATRMRRHRGTRSPRATLDTSAAAAASVVSGAPGESRFGISAIRIPPSALAGFSHSDLDDANASVPAFWDRLGLTLCVHGLLAVTRPTGQSALSGLQQRWRSTLAGVRSARILRLCSGVRVRARRRCSCLTESFEYGECVGFDVAIATCGRGVEGSSGHGARSVVIVTAAAIGEQSGIGGVGLRDEDRRLNALVKFEERAITGHG